MQRSVHAACDAPPQLAAGGGGGGAGGSSAMRDACMASQAPARRLAKLAVQRSPPCVAGLGAPSAAAPVPRGGEASSRDPLATRRSAKGAPRASDELPCALDLVEL